MIDPRISKGPTRLNMENPQKTNAAEESEVMWSCSIWICINIQILDLWFWLLLVVCSFLSNFGVGGRLRPLILGRNPRPKWSQCSFSFCSYLVVCSGSSVLLRDYPVRLVVNCLLQMKKKKRGKGKGNEKLVAYVANTVGARDLLVCLWQMKNERGKRGKVNEEACYVCDLNSDITKALPILFTLAKWNNGEMKLILFFLVELLLLFNRVIDSRILFLLVTHKFDSFFVLGVSLLLIER